MSAGTRTTPGLPKITPAAWGLLAALVGLGAAASLLRYVELVLLTAAGAAALLLAVVSVARPPRVGVGLRLTAEAVSRGEEAALVVTVVNHSRWTAPPFTLCVSAIPADPGAPSGPGAPPVPGVLSGPGVPSVPGVLSGPLARPAVVGVRRLRGGAGHEVVLPLDTAVRAVSRIGPCWVDRRDPFGLAHRRQSLGEAVTLRVRPRTQALVSPPTAPARDPDGSSGSGTAGGLMFHMLREYTPGEDLRLVHWAASARLGTLMVRTHVDPSEPASTVVLDTRRCAYPAGPVGAAVFEDAVDAAASAVLACARGAYGVRLVTSGGVRMTGRRRAADVDSLLDQLAAVAPDEGTSLEVLRTLRRGPVGTLVLVTGGIGRDAITALTPVAHAFGQVIVLRLGPRSEAVARAWGRRTPADRARLRRHRAKGEQWKTFAAGTTRILHSSDGLDPWASRDRRGPRGEVETAPPAAAPNATGSGQVRVLHLATAAELGEIWPLSPQTASPQTTSPPAAATPAGPEPSPGRAVSGPVASSMSVAVDDRGLIEA
ncbi:DUF58 domain-containing protein [Parafrankia sp. EUN1f]|uniref:DUF58 domain-containing protein n=1 Tax=Parafrankia sp. EUN1f TaxID=102897 RepID=UPI0001C45A12|nr:DUF58 domain-containing protein [Parafrankia sp. EUN1f]EFC83952.1 protein of unknown function DUF58 [Parafrankia sp. EUN1f]